MGPHENKTFMHRKSHHLSEEEKIFSMYTSEWGQLSQVLKEQKKAKHQGNK